MEFEWDEEKNLANIQKHHIDFSDVEDMFNHPLLTFRDDRLNYAEPRWISMGLIRSLIGVVVYTERINGVTRIISARKATRLESKRYVQSIKN